MSNDKKPKVADALQHIVGLCKRRGFVFAGSEIYDGLANTWDYGPYGVELKKNIKDLWWRKFVTTRPDVVGLDSSILLNPQVWVASGHVGNFSDPLVDCKACRERFRADHLLEAKLGEGCTVGKNFAEVGQMVVDNAIECPRCGAKDFTAPRSFNLMFKTRIGVVEDSGAEVYLRPETAQGIFLNFKVIAENCRQRVPFGIGQVGKSFRNEITPGNFIFRTREFEQMEMEFFCKPGTEMEWYAFWKQYCMEWLQELGINPAKLRMREHDPKELSHYSNGTSDIEYEFPFGWGELWGIASRTDFDLTAHQTHSKKDLSYRDQVTNEKYIPYVIEPALGVDRLLLVTLCDAYEEQVLENGETRVVLHFHPSLAPVKVAVLPLSKKEVLTEPAEKLYRDLLKAGIAAEYDETQSIGKRYRRQDELGTPFCVTIDFDTVGEGEKPEQRGMVTVRERDSMKQELVPLESALEWLKARLS
jgi:glycyl-tRNA synthetase